MNLNQFKFLKDSSHNNLNQWAISLNNKSTNYTNNKSKIDLFNHDCGLHRILVVKSITKDEENISSWMGTLVK